jgi:hypothetical protein
MSATTTAVAIDLYAVYLWVTDLTPLPTPTLQDFPLAGWALFWTNFAFDLDIRQFQNHNGHDKLRLMVL